jgi:hypothetical protein
MKIVTNKKLIDRNEKIGKYTTYGALLILVIGMVLSFTAEYFMYSFICLIIGFLVSQVGIYYGNRWGKSPRPYEKVTTMLKGLDDKYTLYHYITAAAHLLVGPSGVCVLFPYQQGGTILYDDKKKRWQQKGGNLYMKIFAQESLGRPDLDISDTTSALQKELGNLLPDLKDNLPAIQPILVFTNLNTDVQASNAPVPTVSAEKIKDVLRKKAKEAPLSMDLVKTIQNALPLPDVEEKPVKEEPEEEAEEEK